MGLSIEEFWRQVVHLLFGSLTAFLVWIDFATLERVTIVIPLAFAVMKLIQMDYFPIFSPLLNRLERPEDLKKTPGRTVLAFLLSCWLLLFFFPKSIVLASIMIWTVGDAVGHMFGAAFGRVSTRINRLKNIEGIIIAFLFSVLAAGIFVPRTLALFGAGVGMLVELLPHTIFGRRIPDNFTIPFASAVAMAVVQMLV